MSRRNHALKGNSHSRKRVALRIYERDSWVCQICGLPVDPDAQGDMGASLDHIVPRSQRGSNMHWNLRLAHVACNVGRDQAARRTEVA